MITRFWHVGLTVDDLEKGIAEYEKLGFELEKRIEKPEPHLFAAIMNHSDGSSVELIEFIDQSHPQNEFIKQHMAFISDDLDVDVQSLIDSGYDLVIPKTKGVIVTYAYLKDSSGNCIELAEQKQ